MFRIRPTDAIATIGIDNGKTTIVVGGRFGIGEEVAITAASRYKNLYR